MGQFATSGDGVVDDLRSFTVKNGYNKHNSVGSGVTPRLGRQLESTPRPSSGGHRKPPPDSGSIPKVAGPGGASRKPPPAGSVPRWAGPGGAQGVSK